MPQQERQDAALRACRRNLMRFWKLGSMAIFALSGACSHAPESTATVGQQEECAAEPTANGGYHAECRHGLTYNGKDVGSVLYTHQIDPSRGCDDYTSSASIDGVEDVEPGEVRAK